MKKKLIYLFIITFLICASGCPESFEESEVIKVENKSDVDIFCFVAVDYPHRDCSDTLLIKEKIGINIERNNVKTWAFNEKNACDTIRVFILALDTVKAYSWEKICENNKIIKRYDIEKKEFKEMGWKITYP